MKKIALGVSAAALLLFTQPGIAVSGLGGGGKGGHAFKFFGHHHHKHSMQHNKNWWWYYGYGGVYATQPSATETVAVPVAVAPVETRTCVRVQQPMTVRSEDGGERTVYVTRCQD